MRRRRTTAAATPATGRGSTALTTFDRIVRFVSRSLGAVDAVHSLVPEEAALLLGLVTQLGDVWFLFAVAIACYWFRPADRERVAVVLGVGVATMAVVEALKAVFGVPRPGTSLATADAYPSILHGVVEATATAGGHGFPSGHATLSTALMLGLAGAVRIGSPRRRATIAVGLIGVVSLTRILLGVHFLVDVIAGVLVGLAVLAGVAVAVRAVPTDAPTAAFGLAAAAGVAGLALTTQALDPDAAAFVPLAHDPFLAFATALGTLGGWQAYLLREAGEARDCEAGAGTTAHRDAASRTLAGRSTVRALVVIGMMQALLALGLAGVLVEDATAAQAGAAGIAAAVIVALPALAPDFDAVVEGYVPRWFRSGAGSRRE